MKAASDDLLDEDFWDIGEDRKTSHRKRPVVKGSSSYPSLSVYISCQELESKGDDTGNTVSISIPDIANVSKLRINEQVEAKQRAGTELQEREGQGNDDDDDDKDVVVRQNTTDADRSDDSSDEEGDEEGDTDQADSSCESDTVADEESDEEDEEEDLSSRNSSEEKAGEEASESEKSERGAEEEDTDTEGVVFFDNSERKDVVDERGPVPPAKRVPKKRSVKMDRPKRGQGRGGLGNAVSILYPPHQLLKHWLYRGRKLLTASDGPMAVDAFVRSFALARIVHGTNHWRTARCKVFLARSYLYLFNYYLQAITHSSEACDAITICLASSLDLNKKPQIHHTLAWAYLVHGEAKLSQKVYQATFPILSRSLYHAKQFDSLISNRKRLKPSMQMDDPTDLTLKILCAQSKLNESTHNIYKARAKLEEGLKSTERTKNTHLRESQVGCLLKSLGELLLRHAGKTQEGKFTDDDTKRELEEGVHYLRKSLEIIQKKRPGTAKECEIRFILAKHNLKYNLEPPRAIWWELHKLKIWSSRVHGELSEQTRDIQDCLVEVLIKERNFDDAAAELNEIMVNIQSSLGDYNTQVCSVLRQLAKVYMMKKDASRALIALGHCLSIEIFVFGSSSRRVQLLRLKIKDLLFQVPLDVRKKMLKKHPELQQKPPFRYYC